MRGAAPRFAAATLTFASGSYVSVNVRPGSFSSRPLSYSSRAVTGLSRSACIRYVVSLHTRRMNVRSVLSARRSPT